VYKSLGLLITLGVVSACTIPGLDDTELPPPPPELRDSKAPPEVEFRSVRDAEFVLEDELLDAPTERAYLKVIDKRTGLVFFGRINTRRTVVIPLSVPTTSDHLRYELYDETGWQLSGSQEIDD
jgi:hypothetical protein